MKFLKTILTVLLITFLFSSCTTSEDETITTEKVNFDAKYLAKNKEFIAINNLLDEIFNHEDFSLNTLLELESNNEELFYAFSQKVFEETNFPELIKTKSLRNVMILDSDNKTSARPIIRSYYNYINLLCNNDLRRYGRDNIHNGYVELRHQQANAQMYQLWMLNLQRENATFQAFINFAKQLSNDIKNAGRLR